jgi:predicted Zn-dependent protease
MIRQMGARELDPRQDPRAATVQEVGKRLVERTEAAGSPYGDSFQFHLLEHDMLNAFALPGGQIFITTTLFDKLKNEAQLAGVLGHEMGHVIHRHSAEHMAKEGLGQALVGAAVVGSSGDGRGRYAAVAAQIANQMIQLKYSRADESEADTTGIRYMATAGYDPRGMLAVMQVLKDASGRGGVEWTQSHPLPENRLQQIAEIIKRDFSKEQLAQLSEGRPLPGGRGEARPAAPGDRERW